MDKKNMYFQRHNGTYILLLKDCTEAEGWQAAHNFMVEHNFQEPYVRYWCDPSGNKWFDVGSHTEFFIWGLIDINN